MKIGYACLTVGVPHTQMRTCRKKNATTEKLKELIHNNLEATENILRYNIANNIQMYRISSDLIPFGSDIETNTLNWVEIFSDEFNRLANLIEENNMRVSMHPGQYTVLNSLDQGVVERAVLDLEYHVRVLNALKVDKSHKIILHIGGVYDDKSAAIERFKQNYELLSLEVKERLVIENDDRLYTIEDVLKISQLTGAPVVYDNLHNACNPSSIEKIDAEWIRLAKKTWKPIDGRAKVHYSQQKKGGRKGAHTDTIVLEQFLKDYESIKSLEVDIMLEVKDKNLSAVKCILAKSDDTTIGDIEKEWARYKYLVLMLSPSNYQKVRTLLKDKSHVQKLAFYNLIEEALEESLSRNKALNAFDHIWGHLKTAVTTKEVAQYQRLKTQFEVDEITFNRLKNWLQRLARKYEDKYLMQSLFFDYDI